VGVGSVRKAYFFDLNPKTEKLEREFGFSKLLHEEGDIWEIEKPYMIVYKDDLICSITADFGTVLLEKESAKPSPKDATLKGNVVIHIEPKASSRTKPSTIYLDEVVFLGSKSQFSTTGPVYFVNPDAEMKGVGMELIYNQQLERLEILKIVKLKTLKIKTNSEASLFSSNKEEDEKTPVKQDSEPAKTTAKKVETASQKKEAETASQEVKKTAGNIEKYKCILNKNVVIDCPEQLIFADNIVIDNIKSGSSKDKESPKKAEPVEPEKPLETPKQATVAAGESGGPKVVQVPKPEDVFSDSNDIIVVTCDGSIVFVPRDAELDIAKEAMKTAEVAKKAVPERFEDSNDYRAKFLADSIHHDVDTEKTIAKGNIQLLFYHTERVDPNSDEKIKLPVTVSANDRVDFLPLSNQVIFTGDCLCKMTKPEPGFLQSYNLSGNRIIIDLENKKEDNEKVSDTGIKHLQAVGGTVRLSSVKTADAKQLGGVEIKCRQFDYTTVDEVIVATGPDGIIKIDNSNIAMPQGQTKTVALKKPCWAIVQNFQNLKHSTITNELNIRSKANDTLRIDYIPVDPNKDDQHVLATANSLDVKMTEKSELLTLHAFGGVTYDEQKPLIRKKKKSKPIYFEADEFIFESIRSLITAQGTQEKPGRINNSPFEVIKFDLETGRVIKAKFEGPLIF
ncbi:MAG: LPS export ABC transporter periplasmic protein LptC, partial [Planctomycetes bacterium]|nr:LPS export ABC transporter periplasmic protein LptC [Planctomycetota bacterium]